jgi:bacterioferritin-associated ferredoxin
MVVCHCLRINDRVIAALRVDPAASVDDVTAACGAGGRCGGCRDTIARLLADAQAGVAVTSVRVA